MKSHLFLAIFSGAISAVALEPKFEAETIDSEIEIGYGLAIADVDGDGKDDIVLADKSDIVWYKNPTGPEGLKVSGHTGTWQKHVIASKLTYPRDNVCVAARDLDGDGKCEIAVGANWNPGETNDEKTSGSVHYLIAPEDRTQRWSVVDLPHEPTVHRMHWRRSGNRWQLVMLPLHGRGNVKGEGENGVRVIAYEFPRDPSKAENWKTSVLDDSMHQTHNFDVDWKDSGAEEMIIGGKEGIKAVGRRFGDQLVVESSHFSLFEGELKDIADALRNANSGSTDKIEFPLGKGAGEVRFGPNYTFRGSWLKHYAAIEPMHGNELVLYEPVKEVTGQFRDSIQASHTYNYKEGGASIEVEETEMVIGPEGMSETTIWRSNALRVNALTASDPKATDWKDRNEQQPPYFQVWRRTVLDDTLVQGHALACADLLGLDRQQVVAGWRGTPKAQDNIGIKLYAWNAADNSWEGHWIDEGGMATEDLKVADLNGDGKLDIVAAGRATKNVKIYWNQSTLGTKPELAGGWKKHVVWKGHSVHGASAGDFNGDGKMDIAFSKAGGPSAMVLAPDWEYVELYKKNGGIHSTNMDVDGDGDLDFIGGDRHVFWLENPGGTDAEKGDWHYRVVDSDITGVHHVLEADVNQDGKMDLIANEFNPAVKQNGDPGSKVGDSMMWFETPSDVDAEWRRHIFADGDAGGGSHYMGIGDLDGDGDNDISAGAKGKPFLNGNWFAWWENTGEEAWTKHVLAIEETAATCAMPADLDGDGDMDVFATRGHDAGILWFENQGDKKFELHRIDNLLSGAHCLTVNDLDGDGDTDAATTAKDDKRTVWFENDGKGNFTAHDIDDDQAAYDIRSVDMDGDGDLDLLVAGQNSQNVVWYENQLAE